MVENTLFGNGGTNLHITMLHKVSDHVSFSVSVMFDPQNMGVDTGIMQLSILLMEL